MKTFAYCTVQIVMDQKEFVIRFRICTYVCACRNTDIRLKHTKCGGLRDNSPGKSLVLPKINRMDRDCDEITALKGGPGPRQFCNVYNNKWESRDRSFLRSTVNPALLASSFVWHIQLYFLHISLFKIINRKY
jgi:hypothetical protein